MYKVFTNEFEKAIAFQVNLHGKADPVLLGHYTCKRYLGIRKSRGTNAKSSGGEGGGLKDNHVA